MMPEHTPESRARQQSEVISNLAKRIELLEKQEKLHEKTIGDMLKIMTGESI